MTVPASPLAARITSMLQRSVCEEVTEFAHRLARESGAQAVLFYGSNLRTGSLEGVLDFYVLLPGKQRERIWPRVAYREWAHKGTLLRAKIATMSLEKFAEAAGGASRDTTIWTRFVQPSALVYASEPGTHEMVVDAVAKAAMTAARFAAVLGPEQGRAAEYWTALFQATYRAEFRVETPGREASILKANPDHFDDLLTLAWQADGLPFDEANQILHPRLSAVRKTQLLREWSRRERLGKPLNIARLAKATTTFEGAARYGAWKLERHTGIKLDVTPFREAHPLLAMPGAAWELWRARRAQR